MINPFFEKKKTRPNEPKKKNPFTVREREEQRGDF